MYIIVFRDSYKEPFICVDSRGFKETFSSYSEAEREAKKIVEEEGQNSEWYYDYVIYKEV